MLGRVGVVAGDDVGVEQLVPVVQRGFPCHGIERKILFLAGELAAKSRGGYSFAHPYSHKRGC